MAPILNVYPPRAGVDRLFLTQIDEGARSVDAGRRYRGLDGQNDRGSISIIETAARLQPQRRFQIAGRRERNGGIRGVNPIPAPCLSAAEILANHGAYRAGARVIALRRKQGCPHPEYRYAPL
jgi:hypothetical protein